MDYDVDYKHHNTSVYIGKSVDKFEYHHIINDESQFIGPDEFTNSVTECDYVWFGPPVSRNLILDDDFLDLRKYPSHRSSKMPGMSQAMAKSEFSKQ